MHRFALVLILAAAGVPAKAQSRTADRPNVVLIITDDVGYGDIGSYGAPDIKTPNIDQLGRQGVRLTDFYANAPTCTPTRAGLISGRYQQRFALELPLDGPTVSIEHGLPATGRSLPQLLKNNGYATALLGKWHLGYKPEFSPGAHGFDYFFGFKSGYIDYYTHTDGAGRPDLFENDQAVEVSGYMTDIITDRSVSFITKNRAQPFFLEVAFNAGHWPYQRPDQPSRARNNARHLMPYDDSTSTRADYVTMIERADRGVGQILQTLTRLGLERNTLVIFTNDNGGEWLSRNAPLFHRKWTLWEGGIRVPTIVRWPGRIPAGRVSGQVGITMDLSASILAATNTTVPPDARLDGINLLPVLTGQAPEVERTLFWRSAVRGLAQRAVRAGDWKLIVDGPATLLFNVRRDLGERQDLAAARPDIAARLRPLLTGWEKDVDGEAKGSGAKPTEGFIAVPGGRIWYTKAGTGSGTPLVVIHGGPGSGSFGLKPWAALGNDRPVIRYDQLGAGKADHPTDTTLFTVGRAVAELQALRDSLGLREVHLYGRSWGAMLVEAYMGTHPVGVKSITLSSPLVTTAQWEEDADSLMKALPDSVQRVIAYHEANRTTHTAAYQTAAAEYYRRYVTRQPRRSPIDGDSARRTSGALVYGYMWGPSEFTATGTLKHFDGTAWLREVTIPALFVTGEFDEATPRATERFSKLVPGAEFTIIPNSGHSTENDNPDALLDTVRGFLRRVDAAGKR